MNQSKNKGYDPAEIKMLQDECLVAQASFVYVDDEDVDVSETGELAHFQFVGQYEGQSVICDAILYTLRLHHSSIMYEKAVVQVQKEFPGYLPVDERDANYKLKPEVEEEAEMMVTELIEAMEEEEEVKVSEYIEIDTDFEYGISLDVCLNVEAVTDEVIEAFISEFNSGTFELDPTMYSFSSLDEEQD